MRLFFVFEKGNCMDAITCFKDLAIIIIAAKLLGLGAKKLKAPQVAGQIVAGLLIGPSVLGLVGESEFLAIMAEIGVVLLMFSAGLETNLKELIKTGPVALCIACAGVAVPLLGGFLLYSCFYSFARPCSRSAMISSAFSRPTLSRMRPAGIPEAASSSSV